MPARTEFLLQFPQFLPQALARRMPLHGEVPLPTLPADVREAQKVERLGFAFSSPLPIAFGVPPELNPARFLRMQFQSKLPQPFPEVLQEAVRFPLRLESQHRVVSIAHDDHVSARVFPPRLHPQIEDLVQIDIRQQG
jgi:hypothetical protein